MASAKTCLRLPGTAVCVRRSPPAKCSRQAGQFAAQSRPNSAQVTRIRKQAQTQTADPWIQRQCEEAAAQDTAWADVVPMLSSADLTPRSTVGMQWWHKLGRPADSRKRPATSALPSDLRWRKRRQNPKHTVPSACQSQNPLRRNCKGKLAPIHITVNWAHND